MPYQALVRDGGSVAAVIVGTHEGALALLAAGLYPDCSAVDVSDLDPRPAPGWTYAEDTFTAPAPTPAPEPTDPDPTPTDPGAPANPGGTDSAALAELRATSAAQQETLDWLTDVVTALVTGEDPTA